MPIPQTSAGSLPLLPRLQALALCYHPANHRDLFGVKKSHPAKKVAMVFGTRPGTTIPAQPAQSLSQFKSVRVAGTITQAAAVPATSSKKQSQWDPSIGQALTAQMPPATTTGILATASHTAALTNASSEPSETTTSNSALQMSIGTAKRQRVRIVRLMRSPPPVPGAF